MHTVAVKTDPDWCAHVTQGHFGDSDRKNMCASVDHGSEAYVSSYLGGDRVKLPASKQKRSMFRNA